MDELQEQDEDGDESRLGFGKWGCFFLGKDVILRKARLGFVIWELGMLRREEKQDDDMVYGFGSRLEIF